jgi:hypothetical protein
MFDAPAVPRCALMPHTTRIMLLAALTTPRAVAREALDPIPVGAL